VFSFRPLDNNIKIWCSFFILHLITKQKAKEEAEKKAAEEAKVRFHEETLFT
jgi:hypothetical protein